MWVGFFSKLPDAYSPDDVGAAQLIADHIAVAVAHEHLAKAERDRGRRPNAATNGSTRAFRGRD